MGMGMRPREWEGMGLKKLFPCISSLLKDITTIIIDNIQRKQNYFARVVRKLSRSAHHFKSILARLH